MKPLIGASVVLLAVGCTPDLTEVPVDTPATLQVRVLVAQPVGAADTIRVRATFDPGTDADGNVRSTPDDRLRVGETRYAPLGEGSGGRSYEFPLDTDSLPPGEVALFPPTVEGLAEAPGPIHLPYRFRSGPDVLTVRRGGAASLRMTMSSTVGDLDDKGFWRVNFGGDSQGPSLGSVSGRGQPPDSLAIPTDWVDDGSSVPITATMLSGGEIVGSFVPGSYEYRVGWISEISWSVEVTRERKSGSP